MKNKTFSAKEKDIKREQYVVDANGKTLGRLATVVATVLRGKHKPIFTRNIDCGDYVTVLNASQVKVTGNKEKEKIYFSHSGYPHGHKLLNFEEVMKRDPRKIIMSAVKGMLPKGALGSVILKKLVVHKGTAEIEGKPLKI